MWRRLVLACLMFLLCLTPTAQSNPLLMLLNSRAAVCPAPNLSYWKFNESDTTTTAVDSVGANNGTLTSMVGDEWEAGHLDNALRFDGTNDLVDAGDIADVDTATELSVCAWVYHDVLTSDDNIVSKANESLTAGFIFFRDDDCFVGGCTDTYTINVQDSADTDKAVIEGATNASVATTWTHVCFTYTANDANGLRLYVDGTEDAASPVATTGINLINGFGETLRIGAADNGTRPFDGMIDNVVLHEGVFSQADITALYNGGTGCESS